MDLWVVAAAAGAGYVAKFLKNSKEKEGLVELVSEEESSGKNNSRQFFEQFLDNPCSNRKLGRRKFVGDEGMASSSGGIDGFGGSEMASTSGFEDESNVGYNVLSLSSLSPRFTTELNIMENEEDRVKGNSEISDKGAVRSKNSRRTKKLRGRVVKPLTSLDSCLMAQLYNEHVEMEEYVFSAFPSPSASTARPLLVTDGSRIISRASSDACSLQSNMYNGDSLYSHVKESAMGVPLLPEIVPMQLPKKPKQKRDKGLNGRLSGSSTKVSGKQPHSQGSPLPEKMFLFCLGITFGVMSTVMANKREVDKLNELLKQTENLVQDLHEELEMKDSLTVNVLAHEHYDSQENKMTESLRHDIKRTVDHKSDEDLESRSKIEAELEAELERLEQNMNASNLESRLSDLAELDPDADIVKGELRVDMVKGGVGEETDSERNMSGTSTTKTENANYAVSPRELSIRLHEVIESRLMERITELETALDNSQKKLHSSESNQIKVWSNYSTSEIGDSSSRDSPTRREEETATTILQPLFLNLSDDALDAYNEAYEALNTRTTEIDEEIPPFQEYKSNQFKDELNLWSPNKHDEDDSAVNEVFEIQYESTDDDDDDMMARLLIQQIVEKTRQGSPVVLNAQRMLFSVDEN
ncbi:hypothetical protein ACHQM5_018727 [Ranunculus cassubicifolius]